MFRRTKATEQSGVAVSDRTAERPAGQQGKGRPTPTRREAEEARKARARASLDSKGGGKGGKGASKAERAQQRARIREGQKAGDERYLMERDKGPAKKVTRDVVDSRLNAAEVLLPMMFVILVLINSGNDTLVGYGNALWSTILLVTALDTLWLLRKVRRELAARLPDVSHKGTSTYAMLRTLQFRPIRLPKPQRKIGEKF